MSLHHQDVSSTVVDVLEAVRTQQDPSVPSGHNHHDVAHVQNLRRQKQDDCEPSVGWRVPRFPAGAPGVFVCKQLVGGVLITKAVTADEQD